MRVEVAHFLCYRLFMTASQKLTIKLSSARQKLNELLAIEERSEEQNTELETLTDSVQSLEPELRASIAAEGEDVVLCQNSALLK